MTKQEYSFETSSIRRNVSWNLFGMMIPLLAAIVALPILVNSLGVPRFGVLMIAWAVVGYFGLFDLGLGRALTKLLSEKLAKGLNTEVPALVWTALLILGAVSLIGAALIILLTPWLVNDVLNIPEELRQESEVAFYLLGFSLPIVITTTALRGVLEAYQRFDFVNMVRTPIGILTFVFPIIALQFSSSLDVLVSSLIIVRLISWCAHATLCVKVEPNIRQSLEVNKSLIHPLINFGGWMTVSNIIGPIMVYMDRFFIGNLLTMSAVAYYTTPYEMVTKLWVVSGALMGALFPALAAALVQDRNRAKHLYGRAIKAIFLVLFPLVLLIVTYAYDGLYLWLGSDFADKGTTVLQFLAVGVLINSFAQIAFGLIQAGGHPDITAKLHILELPVYLIALWFLVTEYGVIGAAVAWVLRVVFDSVALFSIAYKLQLVESPFAVKPILLTMSTLVVLTIAALLTSQVAKISFLASMFCLFVYVMWVYIFMEEDRAQVVNYFNA
ncbi:MAG: flippase [Cycloclasticus sp.]|uniref:flippase n=1 Tax=Cycloclasticus sp. TaxID=2024830 RepID=UPI0025800C29|nr:flippase [Cycloclasticus sp.]MBV1898678.1 flippase [Cycloclasticus sp.]